MMRFQFYERAALGNVVWSLSIAALVSLLPNGALAQTPSTDNTLLRIIETAKSGGLQSGEIVLADRSGIRADQAFGLADKETGRINQRGANWLWASVTKQITAVLILQLVEEDKLSLEGTISAYLPEFTGAYAKKITVKQLLQHVSGLPNPSETKENLDGVPEFYAQTKLNHSNFTQAIGFCSGAPKSKPDEKFEYNNCDYLVLGAILEKLSGKTFDELVSERIATPLGLQSLTSSSDRIAKRAIGYTTDGKRYPAINVTTFGASGALAGSARDLAKFDLGLLNGKLVNSESLATMWKGEPTLGYEALGVWSFPARLAGCNESVKLIERRGDVAGIQVRNVIAPDQGRVLVIFSNDDTIDFGEVWQGKGLSFELLSIAFCSDNRQ